VQLLFARMILQFVHQSRPITFDLLLSRDRKEDNFSEFL
jgi:hypothetical protein